MKIALITDTHFGARNDSLIFTDFFRKFYENIFFPVSFVNLGSAILSVMKSELAYSDQIPRLLCKKDGSINATQEVIPYSPRKIEEGILYSQSEIA